LRLRTYASTQILAFGVLFFALQGEK
jgi:hypothetical protein